MCRFEVCGVELTCFDAFSMRSARAYLRCVGYDSIVAMSMAFQAEMKKKLNKSP